MPYKKAFTFVSVFAICAGTAAIAAPLAIAVQKNFDVYQKNSNVISEINRTQAWDEFYKVEREKTFSEFVLVLQKQPTSTISSWIEVIDSNGNIRTDITAETVFINEGSTTYENAEVSFSLFLPSPDIYFESHLSMSFFQPNVGDGFFDTFSQIGIHTDALEPKESVSVEWNNETTITADIQKILDDATPDGGFSNLEAAASALSTNTTIKDLTNEASKISSVQFSVKAVSATDVTFNVEFLMNTGFETSSTFELKLEVNLAPQPITWNNQEDANTAIQAIIDAAKPTAGYENLEAVATVLNSDLTIKNLTNNPTIVQAITFTPAGSENVSPTTFNATIQMNPGYTTESTLSTEITIEFAPATPAKIIFNI